MLQVFENAEDLYFPILNFDIGSRYFQWSHPKNEKHSDIPPFGLAPIEIQYFETHWSMRSTPLICLLYSLTENVLGMFIIFFYFLAPSLS